MTLKQLLAAGAIALAGGTATAGEKHAARQSGNPVYPKFEKQYEKRFTKPTLNCGACFGYYKTNWSSWAEACGQPDVVYASQPQPEVKPPDPKPMDSKVPDPKPVDPKVPDPKPLPDPKPADLKPKVPEPLPVPKPIEPKKPGESGKSAQTTPPAAITVSISIPEVPSDVPPSIPLIPTIPAVNVK